MMRSCMLALQLLGTALGGYAAGLLMWAINSITQATAGGEWIPEDLNEGRLDLMYLTIGGEEPIGCDLFILYISFIYGVWICEATSFGFLYFSCEAVTLFHSRICVVIRYAERHAHMKTRKMMRGIFSAVL